MQLTKPQATSPGKLPILRNITQTLPGKPPESPRKAQLRTTLSTLLISLISYRAITSLVIFVPSLYYLAQPQLNKKKHGGGHGHEDHEKHEGGDQESETPDDEGGNKSEEPKPDEEGEEKNEGSEEEGETSESQDKGDENNQEANDGDGGQEGGDSGADDSSESSSDEKQGTPDTSADEGSEGSDDDLGKSKMRQVGEQVQWKGPTNATESGKQEHETVKYPDAKGGTKHRLQSKYGIKLGEQSGEDQSPEQQDHVSSFAGAIRAMC